MSEEENIESTDNYQQSTDENAAPESQTSNLEPQTSNLEPQTSNVEPQTINYQPQTINYQPQTINYQPQTEMEVHHPHHITHKKKWTEYLLEFFMLFLAVFLGFVAENQREHMVEHQREKQYIQSLIADLESDQQILAQHILHVRSGISMMDSAITILNTPSQIAGNTGQLYFLARLAPRLNPLSTNSRTFEQLKNSGNFRLITDLKTSDKIMRYYERFPLIRLLESVNETEFNEYKKVAAKIFDPAVFLKMEGDNGEIIRTTENPSLRTTDKELLQELSVFSVYMHGTKKGILGADEELKRSGAELIEYLQTEYHLEKE